MLEYILLHPIINFVQGKIFWKDGETQDAFWDVEEDKKFEVTQPESKRQRTEE